MASNTLTQKVEVYNMSQTPAYIRMTHITNLQKEVNSDTYTPAVQSPINFIDYPGI